jgi:hypothetical protein
MANTEPRRDPIERLVLRRGHAAGALVDCRSAGEKQLAPEARAARRQSA